MELPPPLKTRIFRFHGRKSALFCRGLEKSMRCFVDVWKNLFDHWFGSRSLPSWIFCQLLTAAYDAFLTTHRYNLQVHQSKFLPLSNDRKHTSKSLGTFFFRLNARRDLDPSISWSQRPRSWKFMTPEQIRRVFTCNFTHRIFHHEYPFNRKPLFVQKWCFRPKCESSYFAKFENGGMAGNVTQSCWPFSLSASQGTGAP